MKQKNLFAWILTLCLLAALLCGCAGSKAEVCETVTGDYACAEAVTAEEAVDYAAAGSTESGNSDLPQADTDTLREKIIYSADLTMQTLEFEKTATAIEQQVSALGGFVESSNVNGDTQYASDGSVQVIDRYAYYVLRIPCAEFDGFLTQVGTLGNVISSGRYAENVTASYTDYEAKLKSLQTQEQRLLAMLEKATDIETLVALEQHLSEVRYEIESVQSNLTNLDRQIYYSTVRLNLQEVSVYTRTAPQTRSFGERIGDAFRSGWSSFVYAIGEFFIWFISALPAILLLGAVVAAVVLLLRRRRKKRRQKQAAENS